MNQSKLKRCSICKERRPLSDLAQTGLKFWCQPWITPDCGAALAMQILQKQKQAVQKKWKRDRIELDRRTLSWQHNATKPVFNRMRVLEEMVWFRDRAIEPYCISCQKTKMDFCCGHYKSVGSSGALQYDRTNTWLQCNKYCNSANSANIAGNGCTIGYTAGLLDRFGQVEGQAIIDYCETNRGPRKWEWQEVEQIRLDARAKIRELERVLAGSM